jgi:hypothetical protein
MTSAIPRADGAMELKRALSVEVSREALDLLEQLARHGIYGSTVGEVAARFVEERLRDLVPQPVLLESYFGPRPRRAPRRRR